MANKRKFTEELNNVFNYIINHLIEDYPSNKITVPYFIISVLENEECLVYTALSKIMLNENINTIKELYYEQIYDNRNNTKNNSKETKFDSLFDQYIEDAYELLDKSEGQKINSGLLFCAILEKDELLTQNFKNVGVTIKQIQESVESELNSQSEVLNSSIEKPLKHNRPSSKKNLNKKDNSTVSVIKQMKSNNNEVEKNLINLNKLASEGKIDEYITYDDKIFNKIFTILSKKNNNNVIITGKQGVGKTALVRHIANLLEKQKVPESYSNKILMQFDFITLVSGTMYKGAFESRFKPIVEDAKHNGNYILFIDDIHNILNGNRLADTDTDSLMDLILSEKNIKLICTTTDSEYSNIVANHPSLARKFQKIVLDEPSITNCNDILNKFKYRFEDYHSVVYAEDTIATCVDMSKRYISERNLPESALDILDEVGAKMSLITNTTEEIENIQKELNEITEIENELRNSSLKKDYDLLDDIIKKEIEIKTRLSIAKKKLFLNNERYQVTPNDIKELISEKTNIPLTELSMTDKEKLKNINNTIKNIVIGQDEAVDAVCQVVKRQRIGMSSPTKPVVLFFGGKSGCGKTFLAKTLAEKIFGDEKYLVRLDMSEYADKTSTNKLSGSAAGYIGYERGGILTETIKKKKYCVLLLDEIEKANEEVHNMFLQIFDEGRMTDNKGTLVDFKNVIIIMTSNVGASEIMARGGGVGFVTNKETLSKSIISNELKKKFKPEFLNRIDKIVYFNELTEDNLKNIIKIEMQKVNEKLLKIGFSLDASITENDMVDLIFENIKDKKDFGARPIIREVQTQIEDKITDLIIDNDYPQGYVFTKKDIY